MNAGAPNSLRWEKRSVVVPAGASVLVTAHRKTGHWASDHCHTLAGGTPILALDMYEYSYHIDFGAKAATYVDTFMAAIRWKIPIVPFARSRKGGGTTGR
jgi:superoxide dismutase